MSINYVTNIKRLIL